MRETNCKLILFWCFFFFSPDVLITDYNQQLYIIITEINL